MPASYLERSFHVIIWFLIFALWVVDLHFLVMVTFLFYAISFALFRKSNSIYRENVSEPLTQMIYSPINGKVLEVKNNVDHIVFGKDLLEIKMVIPWWRESGIFLPETSEIRDVESKDGKSFFRLASSPLPAQSSMILPGIAVTLQNKKSKNIGLQFIKCNMGQWPEIRVMPGDRGKTRANIGYFPLGGTVLMYLPKEYEILIAKDEDLIAGETVIANLKESQ